MRRLNYKIMIACGLFVLLLGCKKPTVNNPVIPTPEFVHHKILQGQHYSDKNKVENFEQQELRFVAKFDSSAIYSTILPSNQFDINKLYGFADNGELHQSFSARFGWRWSNNALRLFAYVYNNGLVTSQELGVISIGAEHDCSIKVQGSSYAFSLNGTTTLMQRSSTTITGKGYKLFPYFGGDETAPHDIHIWIKEK